MTTEYGQRMLIERDSAISNVSSEFEEDSVALLGQIERTFGGYQSNCTKITNSQHVRTIRFQVVVWNIGKLDVATGSVPMTFRVTLFWNDLPVTAPSTKRTTSGNHPPKQNTVCYNMQGRNKALPQSMDSRVSSLSDETDNEAIDVPPVSILNVSTFTIIGSPEVDLLDPSPKSRLMRWTCMYRATVMQHHLNVQQFPHDCHNIGLELAILTGRRAGQRWDRRFWKLGLANEDDVKVSRKALRVPYGLVVDHVRIPEFHFHRPQPREEQGSSHRHSSTTTIYRAPGGLQFQFFSQEDGSFDRRSSTCAVSDCYLHVSLMVLRESGYYDRNIVPLLALLNVIAATLTLILDPEKLFYRGLLILNIAFNQMGIRLSVDKHLPSVGYEIRMQQILNEFFFVLLALILEAALVYALETNDVVRNPRVLEWVDGFAATAALVHNLYTVSSYYAARTQARQRYRQGILPVEEFKDAARLSSCREPCIV